MVQQAFEGMSAAFRDNNEQIGTTGEFKGYLGNRLGQIVADYAQRHVFYWTDSGDYGIAVLDEGAGIPLVDTASMRDKGIRLAYPAGADSRKDTPHVIGLSREGLLATGGITPSEQRQNAAMFPGSDQIDLLRMSATNPASLGVMISPGPFYITPSGTQNQRPGGVLEITSAEIPSVAGQHRIALAQLDKATNAFSWKLGVAVTANDTLPSRAEFGLGDALALSPDTDHDASGYCYLYYGMAEAVEADIYRGFEARRFLASPAPVVSLDRIMTDGNGNVLSDGNGNVVFE